MELAENHRTHGHLIRLIKIETLVLLVIVPVKKHVSNILLAIDGYLKAVNNAFFLDTYGQGAKIIDGNALLNLKCNFPDKLHVGMGNSTIGGDNLRLSGFIGLSDPHFLRRVKVTLTRYNLKNLLYHIFSSLLSFGENTIQHARMINPHIIKATPDKTRVSITFCIVSIKLIIFILYL